MWNSTQFRISRYPSPYFDFLSNRGSDDRLFADPFFLRPAPSSVWQTRPAPAYGRQNYATTHSDAEHRICQQHLANLNSQSQRTSEELREEEAIERACRESVRLGEAEASRRRLEALMREFGYLEPAQTQDPEEAEEAKTEREEGEVDDSSNEEDELEQARRLSLAHHTQSRQSQQFQSQSGTNESELEQARQLSLALTRSESEPILSERLEQWGLAVKTEIAGDGNCQFAALADQLFNDPTRHPEVRAAAVAWLRANPDFSPDHSLHTLTAFFDREKHSNWGAYCDELARVEVWGDHLSLLAAAEVYGLRIWICSSVEGEAGGMTCLEAKTQPVRQTVFLAHLHERHYDSLKSLS